MNWTMDIDTEDLCSTDHPIRSEILLARWGGGKEGGRTAAAQRRKGLCARRHFLLFQHGFALASGVSPPLLHPGSTPAQARNHPEISIHKCTQIEVDHLEQQRQTEAQI